MIIYTSGIWTAQEMEGVPESWDRTKEVVLQTSDYTTMGRFLVKWMMLKLWTAGGEGH